MPCTIDQKLPSNGVSPNLFKSAEPLVIVVTDNIEALPTTTYGVQHITI